MTIDQFALGSQPFAVRVEWQDRLALVAVQGDLDLANAPGLTKSLDAVFAEEPRAIVIDLSRVAFLASAGMSVLAAAHQRVDPSTAFAVVAHGPATGRPLQLVGLDQTFAVYPTTDEALAELAAG
ncbi:STAS domain-containing protein [Skermania sp. ID1734]|uniref:STAS domain-containing protein n=1 Tax=Skermania sp. ID1734 TaxID=2597516 RepID=UPI00117CA1A5|nr:STAS domain-containing protein [Skermania sp. ID1734]TSD99304.1 STAS domain-containing protein [Skermania sp. ID1734]